VSVIVQLYYKVLFTHILLNNSINISQQNLSTSIFCCNANKIYFIAIKNRVVCASNIENDLLYILQDNPLNGFTTIVMFLPFTSDIFTFKQVKFVINLVKIIRIFSNIFINFV